ncbi:Integrase catalytic core protein [Phytophthora palmivora]|uniref:Integrase catalytic core protein n=1 Tax=Phytophthora palmivora TaxID=4796 RepID=A0A2P4Y0P5_9STRA|nr:Integrase catalytic core protein [Phytophthora palmivora]
MGKYLHGLGGMRYFQLIQDEGSHYKWCFLLKNKTDATKNMIKLMAELLAAGHRIKRFTSDGGGEFVNTELKLFLKSCGIRFVPTYPYTPEENALVEKMNGVLVNKMGQQCMLQTYRTGCGLKSCNKLWTYMRKTPSEKLLGAVPNVAKIRVCGSIGFVYVANRKDKLSPKAKSVLLLGFARSTTGYRLLHLRTGTIVEAGYITFREDITVSWKYIAALLIGNGGDKIPFVPLPVEYVAEERIRSEAEAFVTGSLPKDHFAENNAGADVAPGSGGNVV